MKNFYAVFDTNVLVSSLLSKRADSPKTDAFLVTGNLRHFPNDPIVVSPNEMLKIIEEQG